MYWDKNMESFPNGKLNRTYMVLAANKADPAEEQPQDLERYREERIFVIGAMRQREKQILPLQQRQNDKKGQEGRSS